MYRIKANPQSVTVYDENENPVYSLAVNQDMVQFTAELLVKFVEHQKKGVDILRSMPTPKGLWFEDRQWTELILRKGTFLFGTDYEKFVIMASQNPAMLLAKKTFSIQLNRFAEPAPSL